MPGGGRRSWGERYAEGLPYAGTGGAGGGCLRGGAVRGWIGRVLWPSRRRKAVGDVIGPPPRGGCRPLAGVGRSPEPLEALIGVADQARSERETAAAA